jgi:hypothetical protein
LLALRLNMPCQVRIWAFTALPIGVIAIAPSVRISRIETIMAPRLISRISKIAHDRLWRMEAFSGNLVVYQI